MKAKLALIFVLSVVMIYSCGKKVETPKIIGWEKYKDPYFEIGFKYPAGWPLIPEGGKFSVYSSQEVINRFYDLTLKGKDGVRLIVSTQKMDTLQTLDQYTTQLKSDLTNSGYDIKATESKSVSGMDGILIHFIGAVDRDTRIETLQETAIKDSNLYVIRYEAFNDLFLPCRAVFDTAMASFELPRPKTAEKGEDPSVPAVETESLENNYLKITYPANFETSLPQPKEPVVFAMDIKGYRQDSFIHLDIRPSQGLTTEKVVEQNAKNYKEASRGEVTLDGAKSVYINYSPAKEIQSRVYFLVKNDKFYRIIINYYSPMKSVYLPAFEKTVASVVTK
jgi:hypothetical protein